MKKTGESGAPVQLPEWAARIREVRAHRTQVEFARLCNVSQVTISRWESGADQPTPGAFARLATLTGEPNRGYFWDLSGFQKQFPSGPDWYSDPEGLRITPVPKIMKRPKPVVEDIREIPLLRDAVVAGSPMASDEYFITELLAFPAHWFSERSELCAVLVTGASMAPIINEQSIAIIDTSKKNPKSLLGSMVAIRQWDGIRIKWLRRDGKVYLLEPQQASTVDPVTVLRPKGDLSLVGAVVKWIGTPPTIEHDSE